MGNTKWMYRGRLGGRRTYIGPRGSSVIDYVTIKGLARREIRRMEVEECLGSDHLPLKVEVRIGKGKRVKGEQESGYLECGAKALEEMGKRLGRIRWEEVSSMEEMEEVIIGCGRRKRGERGSGNSWFDEECKQAKREVRRMMRKCIRSGGGEEGRVGAARRKYNDICERKKMRAVEKAGEELSECKNEREMWNILRRGEERRKIGVSLEDWTRKCKEGGGEPGGMGEGLRGERGKDFTEEEVERAFKELKGRKAAGRDGLKAEMWKEIGEGGKKKFRELVNEMWKGQGSIPVAWRVGRMCPVYKGGDEENVESYRGITIMNTGYKISMMLAKNRLEEEVEEKGLLPESRGGSGGEGARRIRSLPWRG